MFKKLLASKTAWLTYGTIATSVGMYLGGELSLIATITTVVASLKVLFLRDAIAGPGPGKYPSRD